MTPAATPKETLMATKILFAPKQPEAVMEMVRNMTPAGFELVVADIGTKSRKATPIPVTP